MKLYLCETCIHIHKYMYVFIGLNDFGYFQSFDSNRTRALAQIQLLRLDDWINKGAHARTQICTFTNKKNTWESLHSYAHAISLA